MTSRAPLPRGGPTTVRPAHRRVRRATRADPTRSSCARSWRLGSVALVALTAAATTATTTAHEFRIEPLDYTPPVGGALLAELVVGERFGGRRLARAPERYTRFTLSDPDGERESRGEGGALPAAREGLAVEGLHVLAVETRPLSTVHADLAAFEAFVTEEGSPEIVALADPYAARDDTLLFRLLLDGEGLPDAQVSVFRRDGPPAYGAGAAEAEEPASARGTAVRATTRTDAAGRFSVDVSHPGEYLLNAVLLRRPSAERMLASGAFWESLWASLTFARER